MSAPYYSPYSPPMTSPYSPYAQPGGGYPGLGSGMGAPQQPGGVGPLPEAPQDSFAPGAPGAEAAPPQEPEAPVGGGEGPQVPTTVFAYKGGFADKNTSLPNGNDAWRNYWLGVGGVGAGYAALAGIAAARSGRFGIGTLGKAFISPFQAVKVAWGGSTALQKSILEGHYPLKFKLHNLAGKSKEDIKGLTEELSKNVEAHVKHTKGLFTTTSEESDKMGHLQTAWNEFNSHLDVKDATNTTIAEKHTSLLDKFKDIENNVFKAESNKDVYTKPIDAHLTSVHPEALQAAKALKPAEGTPLDKEAKQKLHQTAAEKLWVWKNSVETLKGPSDSLKTLAIKPDMNEAEQTALEKALEGLDPLTGKPKAATPSEKES